MAATDILTFSRTKQIKYIHDMKAKGDILKKCGLHVNFQEELEAETIL